MNIFVTGGAGYIGSATSQTLIDAGHKVTVYDSLITGHQAAIPAGAEFIHANINDTDSSPFDFVFRPMRLSVFIV